MENDAIVKWREPACRIQGPTCLVPAAGSARPEERILGLNAAGWHTVVSIGFEDLAHDLIHCGSSFLGVFYTCYGALGALYALASGPRAELGRAIAALPARALSVVHEFSRASTLTASEHNEEALAEDTEPGLLEVTLVTSAKEEPMRGSVCK